MQTQFHYKSGFHMDVADHFLKNLKDAVQGILMTQMLFQRQTQNYNKQILFHLLIFPTHEDKSL